MEQETGIRSEREAEADDLDLHSHQPWDENSRRQILDSTVDFR
jgi:hypothetical protein